MPFVDCNDTGFSVRMNSDENSIYIIDGTITVGTSSETIKK
jgi:hypothetical protein